MANIYDQNVKLQAIADAITNQSITITTGQDLLNALADIANAMQPAAANISYDNTNSGLQAVNVQQAVDENADNISTLNSSLGTKVSTNIEIVNDYPTGTQPKFFRANSPFGVAPYVPAGACGLFIPRSSQDAYLIAMTLDLKMVMVLKNNGAWGTPRVI